MSSETPEVFAQTRGRVQEVMPSQSVLSLRAAVLAGLATALLDFDWNLIATRPHELYPDLLLEPLLFLFLVSSVLVAAGLWIGSRFARERAGDQESSWAAGWISFIVLWVLFFNLSDSRLLLGDLNSVLRLLAVTSVAAIGAYVVARLMGSIAWTRASGEESTFISLDDLLLLLTALLVLLVPFLLTEIILVEGILSAGSILTILCFAAAVLVLVFTYFRRRSVFRWLALGLVILFFASLLVIGMRSTDLPNVEWTASTPQPDQPPIVLITIDTLRADSLGSYGSEIGLTPSLDELAQESVLFERTVASSPWTMPSMASIMTGVSTLVHQTPDRSPDLPLALPTLAESLQNHGYVTLGVGRNAHLRPSTGFSRGFDLYRFYPRTYLAGSLGTQLLRAASPAAIDNEATTRDLARRATALVERYSDEPFFLWLHFFDPHIPYAPPREFLSKSSELERLGARFDKVREVRSGRLFPDSEQRAWIQSLYEGEIRYVDHEIGQFLSTLERIDLFDPALIVVTSDHGEEFWEHGGFEHGHALNNKVIGVPLIIKPPKSPQASSFQGRRVVLPVSIESVRSTILDVVGAPAGDPDLPLARSLVPYWAASQLEDSSDPIISGAVRYFGQQLSVVLGRYKYIRHLEDGREELYDLVVDPDESDNLAFSQPDLTLELSDALNREVEEGRRIANELGIGQGSAEAHMDKETERELRSLGYIE